MYASMHEICMQKPAVHDCGNKALYVMTFSFRQFEKKLIELVNIHDKIVIPCML